ncbi:MAG: DUF4399 domain-containing protein [Rhodocyclaceae bacterium]|nr:DUF4399 domain-containing protein [Rhodocyclaceae bacterium]
MKIIPIAGIAAATLLASLPALAAGVSFVSPADGARVPSEFKVEMAVDGMMVKPAGELVEGTGHHHLIIDGEAIAEGSPVPADDQHRHFGKGQTETTLTLAPGSHTLTLQFADGMHRSYGPAMSSTITVVVE